MTGTINFTDGCIAGDELRLLETKHAILEKLRVRFGKLDENKRFEMSQVNALPPQRSEIHRLEK